MRFAPEDSDLYAAYCLYAEAAHERPMVRRTFGELLTRHPGVTAERRHSGRGWRGIELTNALFDGGERDA